MDMFMDKLAQKLTAEEIIKANTAADTEELNKLKNQIAEYNDCLDRLQKLISEGEAKLQKDTDGLAKLQKDTDGLAKLQSEMSELLGTMDKAVGERLETMTQTLDEKLAHMEEQTAAQFDGHLAERLEAIDENTHKECVKVYRNVQAVVVEESGKQSEVVQGAAASVEKMRGRLGAVLGISVAALVFSLAGVALQVLSMLHIITF